MACGECGSGRGHLGNCSRQRKATKPQTKKAEKGDANDTKKYYGSHQQMINSLPSRGKKGWETVDCPRCRGYGTRGFKDCMMCSGRGKISVPPR